MKGSFARLRLAQCILNIWVDVGTDGHFQKFQSLKACKNKWLDVKVYFMIYYEGYHQVYWKLINLVAMVTYLHGNP